MSAQPNPMEQKQTAPTLHFTEEMKGAVTSISAEQDGVDYVRSYETGKRQDTSLMFHVTIHVADPHRLRTDSATPATLDGWIQSPLFGERCPIHDASFQLFVPVSAYHHEMRYRIVFADSSERLHTLVGYKTIRPGSVLRIWPDTTTLYTRVYSGALRDWPSDSEEARFAGILHIGLFDFVKQMTTLKTTPRSFAAIKDFFYVFARMLMRTYVLPRKG